MQTLQSRKIETNPHDCAEAVGPLAVIAEDLDKLGIEIRALYKAPLPPAVIHQISRGAREQIAIAGMMLDDCRARESDGTLQQKHIANAEKWIAGVRRWMENRQTIYESSLRRKFYVIKAAR